MIIKIDHIALSSKDVESDMEVLKKLNYKTVFMNKNMPNPKVKKQLLNKYSENHDAVLLSSGENYALELVDHKNMTDKSSNIMAVFDNLPEDSMFSEGKETRVSGSTVSLARLKGTTVPIDVYTSNEGKEFRFNKFIFNTANIARSMDFWECCGYKNVEHGENNGTLKFRDPFLKKDFFILLIKSDVSNKNVHLDDKGLTCLAFISNRADDEKKIFTERNFETTPIENVRINGRNFEIFFAKGENGELAEVIGVRKEQ